MSGLSTDFLNAMTREKFLKVLKNNLYSKPALMNQLFAKGRVQEMTGRSLAWNVVGVKHSSVGVFQGYDTLANQPVNPIVGASLSTANYYATVALSLEEEKKNSGSQEKLLDMLKVQFENAQSSLKDRMSTDIYGAGTAVGGRQVLQGLGVAITGATGTYAGINRATAGNEFWRSNADATAYTLANLKDPTSTSYMPGVMRTSYTNASYDNSPDLIVTTKQLYNLYQDIAASQNLRFDNNEANLGFKGVKFGPGVTMIFDDYCTANYIYFLSLPTWSVFVFPGVNFDMKEPGWQIPTDQAAKVAQILWMGQIRCDTPRENAVMSSVGAS